jgi:MFS superfamily sulfate permease-like transporter
MKSTSSTSFSASLAQTWRSDLLSGFMVFLLALPLSLGIAKASGYPAAMGVLTAMVGGLVTSLFKVAPLTIKGPAAGLITICSGAFLEFGGEQAWPMVTAAVLVAGFFQLLIARARWGALADFFPASAVHGMLASIGIIIITKQMPVLLGVDPSLYKGLPLLGLMGRLPEFLLNSWNLLALIGIASAILMWVQPVMPFGIFKKVPGPVWVLLWSVPVAYAFDFQNSQPGYALVSIGDFWGEFGFHLNFSLAGQWVFWKYVFMFLFVNTLESLLTVKAIDPRDPFKRKLDYNGDLQGLSIGNMVSASLGGMPMISEVVRSSANVDYGAKSKGSNFFHGLFLLLAMIFLIPFIEWIPNAALAALLVYAGFRLCHPKHFLHAWRLGKDQTLIFGVTILVTLVEDLLLGVLAGVCINFLIHKFRGVAWSEFLRASSSLSQEGADETLHLQGPVVFSNLLQHQKALGESIERLRAGGGSLTLDFRPCSLVDYSFLDWLERFREESGDFGVEVKVVGLDTMQRVSEHPMATRFRS